MKVRIVHGREAANKAIGKERLDTVMAPNPYGGRRSPRADWPLYCYRIKDNEWVIPTLDHLDNPRYDFLLNQHFEAARYNSKYLLHFGSPIVPPNPSFHPSDADFLNDKPEILAIDTEGRDCIERISLATDTWSATWQWDEDARRAATKLIYSANTLIAHYAYHDYHMLMEEQIGTEPEDWFCTLVAHRHLYPQFPDGLGKIAPLWCAVEPWKHLTEDDRETYSLMDAVVLIPMHRNMVKLATARHCLTALRREQAAEWAVIAAAERGVQLYPRELYHPIYQPRFKGLAGYTSRASGTIGDPDLSPPWRPTGSHIVRFGSCMQLMYPAYYIGRYISGIDLGNTPHTEAAYKGIGPRQFRNGSEAWDWHAQTDIVLGESYKETRDKLKAHEEALKPWTSKLKRQAIKDGFVTNPFGRRVYGVRNEKKLRNWLIRSTQADIIRGYLASTEDLPMAIFPDGLVYRNWPDKVPTCDSPIEIPVLTREM